MAAEERNDELDRFHLENKTRIQSKYFDIEFDKLLLEFSIHARKEFQLPDAEYPIIRQGKVWQRPEVYGVLIGIVNARFILFYFILGCDFRNLCQSVIFFSRFSFVTIVKKSKNKI